MSLLFIPFLLLNTFGGIVSGIWLIWVGNWSALLWGLGIGISLPFLLAFLLAPSLIVAMPAIYFTEKGLKSLALPFLFIAGSWTYVLMVYVSIAIFLFFLSQLLAHTSSSDLLMTLLWSYSTAVAPWTYMAHKEQSDGGHFAAFFAQLFCLGLAIAIYFSGARLVGWLYWELPGMSFLMDWIS